jgi:6,7-dimethyl-8-ribityllumazine synthase
MRILIVEQRTYEDITDSLVKGAVRELTAAGAGYKRIIVPGLLEIPAVIRYAVRAMEMRATDERYGGFVALGCAIDSEDDNSRHICREVFAGLQSLTLAYTLALGCGIITVDTRAQANDRCMPDGRNVGGQAALTCLRLVDIKKDLGLLSK